MSRFFPFQTVFVWLFALILIAAPVFAQNADLQNDLQNSFSKFKIVRLDNQTARQAAEWRKTLTVQTADGIYELNVMPHDLRTANFRAEETFNGAVRSVERTQATTFKGTIAGATNSQVRLTIDRAKIEGYFTDGREKFFIEPARHFSPLADAADLVVYRETDLLSTATVSCELKDKIERGRQTIEAREIERPSTTTLRVIEIATEADFSFTSELGGAAQANNEILSILNMIEGTYETELGLTFDVVFQHAWSSGDPFDGSTSSSFLASFKNYWNANYPQATVPRDVAKMFSSRSNFNGRGLSYLGTVCVAPASAYSFTGRLDVGSIKYVLAAHEIGHTLGANHAEANQGCGDTIMNATVNNLTPITFCTLSRSEITNFTAGNGGSCLSQRIVSKKPFDFDGDGKSDVSVFRPSNGAWYLQQSTNGFTGVSFGTSGDKIVPADYDGDGKTDIAVYRSGSWYRLKSSTNTFDGISFGAAADIPAPADFDGDGKADVVIFRPSDGIWHRLSSQNNAYTATAFGTSGDVPVAADYDGDGKADLNVFRPSTGAWYRLNSSNGVFNGVSFGTVGDKPLAADFDGDGRADVAVYRPSDGGWYRLNSSNNSFAATAFGLSTDVPTAGDYDGDGKTDISVFRPSNGAWYRLNSSNGGFVAGTFGTDGDVPTLAAYIP